jgi:hypothetical protein
MPQTLGPVDRVLADLRAAGYLADVTAGTVVHLARALGKPVLIEGPAGTGKTQLARSSPANEIFQILADPGRHRDLDGSGMLQGVASGAPISGVGDVFVMKMYFTELGDYEMNNHVVEYEPNRRIGWEPEAGRGHPNAAPEASRQARWGQRWSFELTPDGPDATVVTEIFDCSRVPEDERVDIDNGNIWVESMTRTLERLDGLCARQPEASAMPD